MKKLVIPAILTAAILMGVMFALQPVQQATTVHTTLKSNFEKRPNIIDVVIPVNRTISQNLTPKVTDGYLGIAFLSVDNGNQSAQFGLGGVCPAASPGGSGVNKIVIAGDVDGDGHLLEATDTAIITIRQGEFSCTNNVVNRNGSIGTSTTATNVDLIGVFSNLTWPGALGDNIAAAPAGASRTHSGNPYASIVLVLNSTKTVA